jgi:exopolysaccharide biosynthesis predicted pyruvyltransferase EpsI
MLPSHNEAVLNQLRAVTLRTLDEALGGQKNVALLDFPLHRNAGDSLIWLGELAYLRKLGVKVDHRVDEARYRKDRLERLAPECPLLFHGGGNFGDLWPAHQKFREEVISENLHRRIIVLSQSVWFESQSDARRANSILAKHPDLLILVRDEESVARCNALLPDLNVRYCYDMALGFDAGEFSQSTPIIDILALSRRDHEKVLDGEIEGADVITDWNLGRAGRLIWGASRLPGIALRRFPHVPEALWRANERLYDHQARLNVNAAIKTLSRGRVVVTDRLHAHILCLLLGVPHVVLDNSYGKISAIYREYTGAFDSTQIANSAAGAVKLARDLCEDFGEYRGSKGRDTGR